MLRIDERRALLRVRFGEETFTRRLHKSWITVVGIAVGITQFQGFDDGVDVLRAIALHRLEIEVLQDVQRFQQHRTLASKGMFIDLIPAIIRCRRLLDFREKFRKIIQLEWRLMLLQERHHVASNIAFIEAIASGDDSGCAAFGCGSAFGLHHECECACETGQLNCFAGLIHRAVGLQPVALVIRPFLEKLEVAFNSSRCARPQRETVARIFDGSGGHLLEAHRPPFFEHRQRGVNRSRNHGRIETFAIEILMSCGIPVDGRAFGRPALPDNGRHFAFALWVDKDETFAAEAVQILFDDTADEHRGSTGIESIAVLQQNFKGRCRRQWMPR